MYTLRTTVSHKQSSAKFQGSRRRIRAKPRDTKFQLQPYRTNIITVAAERNRRRDRLRETPGLTVDPWNLRYARRVLHDQVRIRVLARLEQILTPSASETPLVIRCSYTWDGRSCAPGTGYAQLYDRTSGSLPLFCTSASVSLVSCGHILLSPRETPLSQNYDPSCPN